MEKKFLYELYKLTINNSCQTFNSQHVDVETIQANNHHRQQEYSEENDDQKKETEIVLFFFFVFLDINTNRN